MLNVEARSRLGDNNASTRQVQFRVVAPVAGRSGEGGRGPRGCSGGPPRCRVASDAVPGGIEEARRVAITAPDQFAALWREHSPRPQPAIDFAHESVVGIFLGTRPTAGYSVEIVSVSTEATGSVVRMREHAPGAGTITAQVLTSPFVLVSVPALTPPVRFESIR